MFAGGLFLPGFNGPLGAVSLAAWASALAVAAYYERRARPFHYMVPTLAWWLLSTVAFR
jgi:hypothetical protein